MLEELAFFEGSRYFCPHERTSVHLFTYSCKGHIHYKAKRFYGILQAAQHDCINCIALLLETRFVHILVRTSLTR